MEEMIEMEPYVDFQSHGEFHPVYPMCSEEELRSDMLGAKEYVEGTFRNVCYAIAFPYGRYGAREKKMARSCGYAMARSCNRPGLNTTRTDPYELKAIGVFDGATVEELDRLVAWAEIRHWVG